MTGGASSEVAQGRTATRRALVVGNPRAGTTNEELFADVAARCGRALDDVVSAWTEGPDGAVPLVERELRAAADAGSPFEVVVTVGGDGTVREAAEGIARASGAWPGGGAGATPALVVIPAGSGNSAYKALWGEREWTEALDAALAPGEHRVRQVDLARVVDTDRGTLLGFNSGLVGRIAQLIQADDGPPGPDKYVRAIGTALEELEPYPQRVTVDGELLYEGPTILTTVGGVRRFGRGTFELLPRSVLDDGLLDVCVIGNVPRDLFNEVAMLIPTGQHVERPEVSYAQGRRVEIERLDGVDLTVEHDGDPRAAGPSATVDVVPGAFAARASLEQLAS